MFLVRRGGRGGRALVGAAAAREPRVGQVRELDADASSSDDEKAGAKKKKRFKAAAAAAASARARRTSPRAPAEEAGLLPAAVSAR